MDPLPTPPKGLIAGKYEVLRLIGRGGMGSVWEGRHVTLETRVAIKFIDQDYANSKEARSRFDTEARAAAALRSKHAIQIYDHGVTEDERPYMVMELLTGEPLDERIERLGRISLQETARILGQVCRALQRAHEAGIIHRDLKPENIFLVHSPDDDDEIAKVLDFGIAKIKALPGEQGLSSSTKTGAVLGTPYYMAPEQARGLRTIDYRADLWSLGIIAFKCVSGALPFEGESVGDLLVKICTAEPPVPSSVVPGLPPAFDAWLARTLQRQPAARFASAWELADALASSAGMTVRRGGLSVPRDDGMSPAAVTAPRPVEGFTPLPAAGMTSAPFVTAASEPRASKGVLFVVTAVALLAGSLGVVAWFKLSPRSVQSAAAPSQPTARIVASANPAVSTAPSLSAGIGRVTSIPTSSAGRSASASSAAGAAASATAVIAASSADVQHKTSPAPRPVITAVAKPAPPKSAPPSSDPGY